MSRFTYIEGLVKNLNDEILPKRRGYLPKQVALEKLKQITGEDFGFNVERWRSHLVEQSLLPLLSEEPLQTGSQCVLCVHFDWQDSPENGIVVKRCSAFPDGIPHEIIRNQLDHRFPHPNDNGLRFTPADETAGEVQFQMFHPTDQEV